MNISIKDNDILDSSALLLKHEYIQIIYTVFPLIIVFLGTIGNLISIKIFTDKRFINTSFAFYNLSVSVVEILIGYVGCLKYFLQAIAKNPLTSSIYWCKFLSYLLRPMLEVTSWIQLVITLDRYLFMSHPNRYKFITKIWFQAVTLASIFIIFLLYHLPVVIYYGYNDFNHATNKSEIICFVTTQHDFVFILNDIGLFFIFCIIPFTIMCFLTISISHSFINMKKKSHVFSKEKKREYHFAFSIIFQNILFLIFTLPLSSTMPILSLYKAGFLKLSVEAKALIDLLIAIFNLLLYFYFSTKFLIYIIFNSLYRQIFLEIFHLRTKRKYITNSINHVKTTAYKI